MDTPQRGEGVGDRMNRRSICYRGDKFHPQRARQGHDVIFVKGNELMLRNNIRESPEEGTQRQQIV